MENTDRAIVVGAGVAAATVAAVAVSSGTFRPMSVGPGQATAAEAARLLTQCTFGVTEADIAAVQNAGFSGWLDQQMAMTPFNMLAAVRQRLATATPYRADEHSSFVECFWEGALTRPDQLRQRMQFALSQIFVVTRETEELNFNGSLACTNYYDLLGKNAFGNWRS